MVFFMVRGSNAGKRKVQSYPVNTDFYISQIIDMSAGNTYGKSVKYRNSIKI